MRSHAGQALDCSKLAPAVFWSVVGVSLALAAQFLQGPPNTASLLRVGSTSPLREQIEIELGPVMTPNATGHDGQIYYVIARDPFARRATVDALRSFDLPQYRYRRILFPLLAGGFGTFSPRLTLFGLMFWTVAGMALTTVAVADLAFRLEASGAAVMTAVMNLGALLSTMLLTGDVMALGLALGGMTLFLRGWVRTALVVFALSALTKETYLLVPLALGAWQWLRRERLTALRLITLPALPLAVWSLWLWFAVPEVSRATSILGAPLIGVVSSAITWIKAGNLDASQGTFAIFLVGSLGLATAMLLGGRNSPARFVVGAWLTLAIFAGGDVWIIPTNAARAFPILWPLGILLLSQRRQHRPDQGESGSRATTSKDVPNGSHRAKTYSVRKND
jgi:hypothetical protein